MAPTITTQLTDFSCTILCAYTNTTTQLQSIGIVNSPECQFERMVFPGERLLFEAKPDADLEVRTSYLGQGILIKKILALHLKVQQF
jgi:hypothetical protein